MSLIDVGFRCPSSFHSRSLPRPSSLTSPSPSSLSLSLSLFASPRLHFRRFFLDLILVFVVFVSISMQRRRLRGGRNVPRKGSVHEGKAKRTNGGSDEDKKTRMRRLQGRVENRQEPGFLVTTEFTIPVYQEDARDSSAIIRGGATRRQNRCPLTSCHVMILPFSVMLLHRPESIILS